MQAEKHRGHTGSDASRVENKTGKVAKARRLRSTATAQWQNCYNYYDEHARGEAPRSRSGKTGARAMTSVQAEKHREHAGSDASLRLLVLQDVAPVRRLPTIDDTPGPTACAAADVQVVSSRSTQAAMSKRRNRLVPVG